MQYKQIAVLAALAAPFVGAQNLSNLPSCALQPALSAIQSSGCGLSDYKCICSDTSFLTTLEQDIKTTCSLADQQKAAVFAYNLCIQYQITLPVGGPAPATSSLPASSPVAPTTTTAAETTPATTTTTAAVTSLATTAAASTTVQTVVSQYTDGQPQAPTGVANATTPATATITPFTGAASSLQAFGGLSFAAAIAAVFAL
ncbi:MAG: hypothetical protein MMC33_006006 [Icmadophila ericetorum]|nr:hypothetical protein [Icmadophila ericetorum]